MDNWLSKLERRFGSYAIPNIMYYIIIFGRIHAESGKQGILLSVSVPGRGRDPSWAGLEGLYFYYPAAF